MGRRFERGREMTRENPRLALVVPIPIESSLEKLDDAALAALVRDREVDAVREMYRRYSALAERVLVRIAGLSPDRGDLLHDVFIRAIDRISELRDPSALRPWICGIAVRRAQEFRRERRKSALPLDIDPKSASDPMVGMELRRVQALLDKLDEDERTPFLLRRIDGMELAEVAEICAVSLATVKRRIGRAEEKFLAMASKDPFLMSRLEGRRT
jgi:RNA polymerase sigma-70 factor, ECF subfamily